MSEKLPPELQEQVLNVCKSMYDIIAGFGARGVAEVWLYEPVKDVASQREFDLMVKLLVASGTVKQHNGMLTATACMN